MTEEHQEDLPKENQKHKIDVVDTNKWAWHDRITIPAKWYNELKKYDIKYTQESSYPIKIVFQCCNKSRNFNFGIYHNSSSIYCQINGVSHKHLIEGTPVYRRFCVTDDGSLKMYIDPIYKDATEKSNNDVISSANINIIKPLAPIPTSNDKVNDTRINSAIHSIKTEKLSKYFTTKFILPLKEEEKRRIYLLNYNSCSIIDRDRVKRSLYNFSDGSCEICGKKFNFEEVVLDHDHETDKIRGVLCSSCNVYLGKKESDIKKHGNKLIACIKYLYKNRNY